MSFPDNSKHILKTWLGFVRTSVVREMEFRANFWMGIAREVVWFGVFLFVIEVIFRNTTSLAGWSKPEMLIILGLARLIEGAMNILFIRNIGDIPQLIQDGMFDYILTKPIPAQWHAAFRRFMFYHFGMLATGIVILVYALTIFPASISILNVLAAVALIAMGIIIFYSLLIIVATLGFFLERLDAIWAFFYLFTETLIYPLDIFPRGPRIAITYFIPIAFVVFVPAQALTGRLAWWQIPVALVLASIFLLLANLVWRAGLRRYSSASS